MRIIIKARENKGFICTEDVWGYKRGRLLALVLV